MVRTFVAIKIIDLPHVNVNLTKHGVCHKIEVDSDFIKDESRLKKAEYGIYMYMQEFSHSN